MVKQPYLADFRIASSRYIAYLAVMLLAPFAINHFIQDRFFSGIACLAIVGIFVLNAISTVRGRPLNFLILFGFVPIITTMLSLAFYEQGIIAALWCYPAMMAFYLMLPERQAWVANGVIFVMAVVVAPQVLEVGIAIRVSITLASVSIFTAIFIRAISNQCQHLQAQVVTDSLTGLLDRITLNESIEQACDFSMNNNAAMALIALDLDYFKSINDEYGHAVGDTVLMAIAGLLKSNIRKSDMVFRLGGEEFLALLYKTDVDEACQIAEKLRVAISSLKVLPRKITCSFGVAAFESGESKASWMKRADNKLYDAKTEGRNCICS